MSAPHVPPSQSNPSAPLGCVVYWFRRDLRLDDNPALRQAIAHCERTGWPLLPVAVELPKSVPSVWGDIPRGSPVQAWTEQIYLSLEQALESMGSQLYRVVDLSALAELAKLLHSPHLYAEEIALPQEQAEQRWMSSVFGGRATFVWQSGLFNEDQLPFGLADLPRVFTPFRQKIENAGLRAHAPCAPPSRLPSFPGTSLPNATLSRSAERLHDAPRDGRSSIACDREAGERGAQRHWQQYLDQGGPHRYFETRNQLSGHQFSSQLSVDLAWGSLSVRRAMSMLDEFEAAQGRTKSSYWLWFECMWREHFRWIARVHGKSLFRARGLASSAPRVCSTPHDWQRWTKGETGHGLIDAGMHELAATGYLSNRMRQIVASYWVHDMQGDWRAGAAWFESQLIDEDGYSNTGNWLYIAGLGTDPRGGRRFDPDKQAREHDPLGTYQRLWA